MHDRELYRQILGIQAPWEVSNVEVDLPGTGVTVHIRHSGEGLACPECSTICPGYDTRTRKWRHLDTCQYKTWLVRQSGTGIVWKAAWIWARQIPAWSVRSGN